MAVGRLPRGDVDFLPPIDFKWSWRAAILAWVVVVCVLAAQFSFFSRGWVSTIELVRHGTTTSATVVKLELNNHGGCRYAYSVDARTYVKSDTGCGDSRHVGDHLEITYVPSHPAESTANSPSSNLENAVFINFVLATLGAFLFGWGLVRESLTRAYARSLQKVMASSRAGATKIGNR